MSPASHRLWALAAAQSLLLSSFGGAASKMWGLLSAPFLLRRRCGKPFLKRRQARPRRLLRSSPASRPVVRPKTLPPDWKRRRAAPRCAAAATRAQRVFGGEKRARGAVGPPALYKRAGMRPGPVEESRPGPAPRPLRVRQGTWDACGGEASAFRPLRPYRRRHKTGGRSVFPQGFPPAPWDGLNPVGRCVIISAVEGSRCKTCASPSP